MTMFDNLGDDEIITPAQLDYGRRILRHLDKHGQSTEDKIKALAYALAVQIYQVPNGHDRTQCINEVETDLSEHLHDFHLTNAGPISLRKGDASK